MSDGIDAVRRAWRGVTGHRIQGVAPFCSAPEHIALLLARIDELEAERETHLRQLGAAMDDVTHNRREAARWERRQKKAYEECNREAARADAAESRVARLEAVVEAAREVEPETHVCGMVEGCGLCLLDRALSALDAETTEGGE